MNKFKQMSAMTLSKLEDEVNAFGEQNMIQFISLSRFDALHVASIVYTEMAPSVKDVSIPEICKIRFADIKVVKVNYGLRLRAFTRDQRFSVESHGYAADVFSDNVTSLLHELSAEITKQIGCEVEFLGDVSEVDFCEHSE